MWKKNIALATTIVLGITLISCSKFDFSNKDKKLANESLLLHYGFDEAEGSTIKDLSGNNNDGEVEGNLTLAEDGVSENALSLDGDSAVRLPDELLNKESEVTISIWVNLTSDSRPMSEWQRIFDLGADANTNLFLSKNKQVEAKVMGSMDNLGANGVYNPDEWVHVAVTAGNGKIAYYENGIKIKEKETNIDFETLFMNSFENYIGKSKYAADPKMIGKIDEFRVYNKILDEETIENIMYNDMSDSIIIRKSAESMEIQNFNNIYKDINLPTELENDVTVKWSSTNKDIISNEGKVTRPNGNEAVEVSLIAKLNKNKVSVEYEFKLLVMPIGVTSYNVDVNVDEKLFDVSDMLFGLFFEDINHGADGGLYAELIENRSFEYTIALDAWEISDVSKSEVKIKYSNPLNSNNTNYLNIIVADGENVKLSNDGYKGISIKKGDSYDLSLWARNIASDNTILVKIEDKEGKALSNEVEIKLKDPNWMKYLEKLEATEDSSSARLVLNTKSKGEFDIDMISLFSEKNVNSYGLRQDLVSRLDELNPSFLRFPGGCVIEGHNKNQMYNWKNTIGSIEERKETENLWGYSQSYGLGYYEYLLLSEELKAEPIPILNAGMTCQGGIHQGVSEWMASIGDELDVYIQDALDFIEYSNGDGTGPWSSKRVAAGHKEPFNIKYLGIGNEQWGTEYYKRFEEFQKVINEKYPDIVLISAAGPIAEGGIYNDAWNWVNEKAKNTIVDEHYYMEPEWFLANTDRYNNFDRKGAKVFIGEYASKSNNLKSAIAEAAYFTGIEKNSDVIKMTSYAPLLAKYDDYQWAPNMIWFNGETSYGSANFYVQKLMGNNLGTQMLKDKITKSELTKEINNEIFTSSSYDKETGDLIIKVVNVSGEPKEVNINLDTKLGISENATVEYVQSNLEKDENSFENPENVSIRSKEIENISKNFTFDADKYSANVIRIKFK